jgi:CRP/FNR family transcriptional regulator, dissimilatory nitrate respiration regulator
MDYELLSRAPLFKGVGVNEIEKILSQTPHRMKKFRAGSLIAHSGETVDKLMVVVRGTVKGEMVDYAGRVIKIEDIPAPGALASAFIFGGRNRFPVNVVAVSETELLLVEKRDFLRLMTHNDSILINFLDMISNRSQFLSEKIKFLNFKTIKGKLAHMIIQKAGGEGKIIRLEMTQNDLAEFFGVARPSVARALREMEDQGFLRCSNREIVILDRKGLNDLVFD